MVRYLVIFMGGEVVEALVALVGAVAEGWEVLEYIFRCQVVLVCMGLAIYVVVELLIGLISMTR